LRFGTISSIDDASDILEEWDERYNGSDKTMTETLLTGKDFGCDKMNELYRSLPDAIRYLNAVASDQRSKASSASSAGGRCVLGICASSADEGIAALTKWVSELNLPRGLLFGMDEDGAPKPLNGGVYLKYNTAVARARPVRGEGKNRKNWNPGDVLASSYGGKFRGVYFQVELSDKTFRQYMVPANVF